jgi:hypothetical protein
MRQRLTVVTVVFVLVAANASAPACAGSPPRHVPRRPVQIVRVVKSRGFSWHDAGIAAAVVGLAVAAVAATGLFVIRVRTPRPTR